jgi:hypothetical protein
MDSRADGMGTTMQIAQPVESLQGKRQAGQQPDDEQAALVVAADMFQSIAILSIVEAFIFNLPSTLGHVVQTAAAAALRRQVGEPVGLDDIAPRFVLAIAKDTTRSLPSRNSRVGGRERKRFSAARSNSGSFSFSRATTGQPALAAVCRKGAVANSPSTTT